ncbi:MAG: enoyl-CoA hydratase/isomerase family protein [Hyphomonadaceae bacterium]
MDWTSPPSEIARALLGADGGVEILDAGQAPAWRQSIAIGLDRDGDWSAGDAFDIAITTKGAAPRPWIHVPPAELDAKLSALIAAARARPVAAQIARFVLRVGDQLPFDAALDLESLAYSLLLASDEFKAWRAAHPFPPRAEPRERVRVGRSDAGWLIELSRPQARNAFDAQMRDALVEALDNVGADPTNAPVELRGVGPSFSAGGDLAEFGAATDPGLAHLVRTTQSPGRLIWAMRERVTVRLHGACIGAGIEIPAAASRVVAAPGATMGLPEVSMGLIPGAGGCATIPRRIGRHRTLYWLLSGETLSAEQALHWRLIDAIEPL